MSGFGMSRGTSFHSPAVVMLSVCRCGLQGSHKENLVNFVPAIFLPPFPGLVSRILATWGLSFLATPVRYLSPSVLLFPR